MEFNFVPSGGSGVLHISWVDGVGNNVGNTNLPLNPGTILDANGCTFDSLH